MTDAEELLEKGARAVGASMRIRKGPHEIAEAAFDAVFPGWREGITREWTCNHRNHLSNSFEGARWLAERDEGCDPVYTRVAVTSAWVPVEEGTDG